MPADLVNNKKYGIARLFVGTTDDANYTVEFFETDWNTYRRARMAIEANSDLRDRFSHVEPEKSLLPQIMALHFLVRFADGSVLAMKRGDRLHCEAGRWSFSAEEQLKQGDWQSTDGGVAEFLFRRAFVEEILGRRESDEPAAVNAIWTGYCAEFIKSYRLWSILLEERAGCFSPFGVFQLAGNPEDLCDIHNELKVEGYGRDDEGSLYFVNEADIETLLSEGSCKARSLYGDGRVSLINSDCLHTTSRYRLWRLYCALPPKSRRLRAKGGSRRWRGRLDVRDGNLYLDDEIVFLDMTSQGKDNALIFVQALRGVYPHYKSGADIINEYDLSKKTRWDDTRNALPKNVRELIEPGGNKGYKIVDKPTSKSCALKRRSGYTSRHD